MESEEAGASRVVDARGFDLGGLGWHSDVYRTSGRFTVNCSLQHAHLQLCIL
jgi:hypothetical protein